MRWPWRYFALKQAHGLTGDTQPIKANGSAQLIDCAWTEPRLVLVSAELVNAGAGAGRWLLQWGMERGVFDQSAGAFEARFTRLVLARSVRLAFVGDETITGAEAHANAVAVDAQVSVSPEFLAMTVGTPMLAGAPNLATLTQVATNVASVAISAAGTSRGRTVFNHSPASRNLFLRLGVTAATVTAYTVRLVPNAYYEVPFGYVGAIQGIWDGADASGFAQVGNVL